MKITLATSTPADLEETTVSSEPARALPRRTLLAMSGTAVLATAAACSPGGASPTTPAGTTTSAAGGSPTSAASSAASSTASSASSAPSAPSAGSSAASSEAAPTGTPVASVADVQAAGSIVVGENENAYLLAYTGDTVVAHTAVCTHQRCTVGASGLCPCHQSRFDVATGAVIDGPALRPLAERGVTVSGGQVYLA